MELLRKEDLSVYYFIKDLFSTMPIVNIVDSFPDALLTVPTVAVDEETTATIPWEIGDSKRMKIRAWNIDIFAINKTQRNELAYKIMESLEDNIPVYDYDEGFPPVNSPTQIGCLEPDDIRVDVIKIMPELVEKMYYRATVSFVATYSVF